MNTAIIETIVQVAPSIAAVSIAIASIIWGREYKAAKNATIENLENQVNTWKDRVSEIKEQMEFLEKISSKDKVEYLINNYQKELENIKANNKDLEAKFIQMNSDLGESEQTVWLLLQSRIIYTLEDANKARSLMKSLVSAFDYLMDYNLTKVIAHETISITGVTKLGWAALIKAGLFVDTENGEYVLTKGGR